MNQNIVEMDPLSVYDYQAHQVYNNVNPETNTGNIQNVGPYNDNVKMNVPKNIPQTELNLPNHIQPTVSRPDNEKKSKDASCSVENSTVKCLNNLNISNDKSNLGTSGQSNGNIVLTKPFEKGKRKVKKERSNYWSEKITDKDYPFYGCSVCNICYVDLADLDKHVATHKDRITSYDLRVKNQLKRKKLKKEKKKLKKLGKEIKKEDLLDIEIKPEDGYIGNEKAAEYENKDIVKPESGGSNDNKTEDLNKEGNKEEPKVEYNKDLLNLEKIFKCFACQKQFTLSYYLKLHVRSHTDEKPYTCPTCGQTFITASKLGRHNKRFHLQVKYQCRICYRYFSRFECLTTHFDRKHPDDKIEGEPYDYNAILPYLKELEEQLKAKAEENKPKIKDPWTDGWTDPTVPQSDTQDDKSHIMDSLDQNSSSVMDQSGKHFMAVSGPMDEPDNFYYEYDDYTKKPEGPEEPKPEVEVVRIEIKAEVIDQFQDEDVKDENSLKDESPSRDGSDDEYFPDNTWVQTKEEDLPPIDADPLTCRVCSKKISTASYMKIHMRTHTGERPFKCYICDSGFITSSKMHRHVLTHATVHNGEYIRLWPKIPNLPCRVCSKKISTASYMKIHMRTHTGERPFKCYICDSGFITSSKMHRHVLTHATVHNDGTIEIKKEEPKEEPKEGVKEEEDKKNKEDEEGTKKPVKGRRKFGMKRGADAKKRPHACEFCQQRFLHLETLQVHKMSHKGEAIVYKCQFCLLEMENDEALKSHEATHDGPKPYVCTICGKGYKKRETMVYHRKHHKPDAVYACALCSKSFSTKCKLQRHALTHRRERYSLRYECPVCAHMFHTKYHVRMHLATHQREGLIVEQNRNEILAMVLQNARKVPKTNAGGSDTLIPADERSRVCNICGEVFQHFFYLEEHLKNHASKIAIEDEEKPEEKKHVCQVCNKSFKLHYYLKLHSFTHTKEKPYICQECGKGFITRGKLKRHLETHAGLKKFQCHVCCKYFTRPSYLRTHIRTIHGTQDYNFRLTQNLNLTYPSAQIA
ncbi:uncharacterized protein [Epargyreus clarus]|uniref:uncharacterized protein n=1 Tax=Epargyreus clarus TaxID=520877 RepID=UPI003C2EC225